MSSYLPKLRRNCSIHFLAVSARRVMSRRDRLAGQRSERLAPQPRKRVCLGSLNLSQKATHPPSNKARWQPQTLSTPGPFFFSFFGIARSVYWLGADGACAADPRVGLRDYAGWDSVTPQRLPKPTRGQWPAAQKTITPDSSLRRRAINGVRSRYKRLLASAKWSFLPINE